MVTQRLQDDGKINLGINGPSSHQVMGWSSHRRQAIMTQYVHPFKHIRRPAEATFLMNRRAGAKGVPPGQVQGVPQGFAQHR